jgi:O-succinylbenzoic acid--CoA ligase
MDASLLIHPGFWDDPEPVAAEALREIPELMGHILFETSGSSGVPKQVAISKRALLVSAAAVNRHLQITPESCWGLALPLQHVGGVGVIARAYEAGCALKIFHPRWEAAAFERWLGEGAVTHTALVPTQVYDLVKARLTAPGSLRAVVVGGGLLDSATGQAARRLGWPVLASYGMSETGSQVATQGLDALASIYQPWPLPLLPIWETRTAPDSQLELSGPALFSGYVSNGRFAPRIGAWHATADRVILEDRTITLLGRADSLVKILGELVDPEAIERELLFLSGGALIPGTFAVIPVPDERSGNSLIPIFESGTAPAVIASTLASYQSEAPGFRRLGPGLVIDKFPRSGLGKLRRGDLLKIYQEKNHP